MTVHSAGVAFSLLTAIGFVVSLAMTLVLVRRAWLRGRRGVAGGWALVMVGLLGMWLLDSGQVRPRLLDATPVVVRGWPISWLDVIVVLASGGIGAFVLREVRSQQVARWCLLIALVVGLTNPLTEAAEGYLISDGRNYEFIAFDQPYRFRDEASLQLDRIQTVQEMTEGLSIVMLALGLSLVVLRRDLGDSPASAGLPMVVASESRNAP